jgi:pSer/pThr/pTyr-binding forkhead associated (FHA) protein
MLSYRAMRASWMRVHAETQSVDLGATEVVIGRSPYCTLVLEDPSVSRVHASLQRLGDHCRLKDLGSKNGTFVNDRPIGEDSVLVGLEDSIRVGDVPVRLEIVESANLDDDTMREDKPR